jgi:hypothetical protein
MTQTKRDTLVLQVGGWAWGVMTPPWIKTYVQKTSEMPRMESINKPGCKEKELIFGTRNVRTLKNKSNGAKQETWKGKNTDH